MTPEPTPLVTVLPCDRDATADLVGPVDAAAIQARELDGNCLVQAFARHRLAALEEAAKAADERAEMRRRLYEETPVSINAAKAVEAEEIATAIRALSNKGGRDGE